MRKLPTDLKILNVIYDLYFDEYAAFDKANPERQAKIYVPIDIRKIAEKLRAEPDIVFGRLYYVLDRKYRYKNDRGSDVPFFTLRIGDPPDLKCVHFPMMASVLADLRQENRIAWCNIGAAVASAFFAGLTFLFAVWPGR